MANHGWLVGSTVAPKNANPKTPRADEQLEIGFINDDGTIGLHPVNADGEASKSKVVMTDQVKLQKTYRAVDKSSRLSKWTGLSDAPATPGLEFWLSVATQAVACANHEHRHCPLGSLYIQKTPSVKVIVANSPDEKGFMLIPFPCVVRRPAIFKEASPLQATIMTDPLVVFNVDKPDLTNPDLGQLAYWRMRRVSDKQHANMEHTTVEVTCPLPKLGKSFPKNVKVHVTVATLISTAAAGDELVLFVPAKEKQQSTAKCLPVASEPTAKRAKTES